MEALSVKPAKLIELYKMYAHCECETSKANRASKCMHIVILKGTEALISVYAFCAGGDNDCNSHQIGLVGHQI